MKEKDNKLRIYDPLSLNYLKLTKIFWNSKAEILTRILGIIAHFLAVVLSVTLFYFILTNFAKSNSTFSEIWTEPNLKLYILIALSLFLLFLAFSFILPLILARSASTLLTVAIVFIVFGILNLILFSGIAIGSIIYLKILDMSTLTNTTQLTTHFNYLIYFAISFYLLIFIIDIFIACYFINKVDKIKKTIILE